MTRRPASPPRFPGEGLVRLLVACMPPAFRARHGADALECHRDLWREEGAEGGRLRRWRFGLWAVASTARVVAVQWWLAARAGPGTEGGATATWDRWTRETRHALRRLSRRPGFVGVVLLTLGLGLGANAAVFTVLHSVLLAPLPYEGGERLVRIYGSRLDRPGEFDRLHLATPAALELRDHVPSFESVAVLENLSPTGADLTGGERPERVRILRVGADYFRTLGASPLVGRVFRRAEEVATSRVAVLSEAVWRRHLGGGPGAVGSSVVLDDEAYTVVGVMDDGLRDPMEGRIDVWLPLALRGEDEGFWDNNWLTAFGRLAPGATLASLRSELDALERAHGDMSAGAAVTGFTEVPLRRDLVGGAEPVILAVTGAVLFLLVLTVVNLASLFLAEAATRERELAVRASLGSSRADLVGRFLVEALLLSLAGGVAGLVLGFWSLDLVLAVAPGDLPRADAIRPGSVAVWVAGGGAVVLGLAVGLATALPFTRPSVTGLVSETRGEGAGRGRPRLRAALVRVEVALAVVLLVGAGVLLRSVQNLRTRDLGADPRGVLTFQVGLPDARYGTDEAIYDFDARFHERVAAIPGVRAVGVTSRLPATGSFNTWGTRPAYGPDDPWETDNVSVNQRWIAGDYFEATGIALLRGRLFDGTDEADVPYRTVVNQALVARFLGDREPLGQWLLIGGRYTQIVGVVEDEALTPRAPAAPIAYHHRRQWISGSRKSTHVVRAEGDPMALLPSLRAALAEVDPDLVLFEPALLEHVVGRGIAQERFAATLLVVFAVLAVAVAGLGLYGVLSHMVGRQRHEIGVRMALGADRRSVVAMVVARGLTLALTGAAMGVVLALAVGSALDFLVFEVSPRDPVVMGAAPALLLMVAGLASLLPAARATRVDPAASIRAE